MIFIFERKKKICSNWQILLFVELQKNEKNGYIEKK